jgi:hypothetical protein
VQVPDRSPNGRECMHGVQTSLCAAEASGIPECVLGDADLTRDCSYRASQPKGLSRDRYSQPFAAATPAISSSFERISEG